MLRHNKNTIHCDQMKVLYEAGGIGIQKSEINKERGNQMFEDISYNERDLLFITYKRLYLQVHGYPLPYTEELIIIRSGMSVQQLKELINELDLMMLKRTLHSVY